MQVSGPFFLVAVKRSCSPAINTANYAPLRAAPISALLDARLHSSEHPAKVATSVPREPVGARSPPAPFPARRSDASRSQGAARKVHCRHETATPPPTHHCEMP
jgi:hypothetical protein